MPVTDAGSEVWGWRTILDLALRHRRELVVANLVAIAAVLASIPIPLLMPLLVDEVLLHKPGVVVGAIDRLFPPAWHGPVLYIGFTLIVVLLLRLTTLLLNVWQNREFTLIAKDVSWRLRSRLLAHLQRVSMAEFETLGSGAVASHLVTDVNVIDEFIGAAVSRFLVAALTLLGISAVLLWMHWKLALLIIFVNPFVVYLTVRMGNKVKSLKKRENSAFEAFQQSLTETLDAMQQIRASNRGCYFLGKVDDKAREVREHAGAFSWKSDAASRLSFFIFLGGFEIFRAVAMLMVLFSGLTIGKMMAVFGYLWFMMTPVQEVLNIQYAWFGARAALGRLNQLLGLRPEPRYPHLVDPFAGKQTVAVSVRDLSFAYRPDGPRVLDGVDLEIEAGGRVALVGASGGGKSTLAQVLIGLYPPDAGQVCFDGVPHDRIGLDVIRENVATVLQNPALFNASVRMNLTMGRAIDDESLWRALAVAQLDDVIRSLDRQLDTVVGRQGVRLSGGQRQRLAIARMVLSDPRVVVLDEATSALDTVTEARLHAALAEFLHGRTTLIIAHRLSAVRQADRVYVFDNGRIIEQGSHRELIRHNGYYQKLYGTAD